MKAALKWLRNTYGKMVSSIAFYPALIAIGFLLLSWVMLEIDFSESGKHFKQQLSWLSLKDASTARTIVSTIAAGILSLTVFSFSMVMIVLNQAASQMSNRILNSMIENRFQQVILGFFIGAIVYALFLLSTIRDINSGIYVPALSIYLLIFLTVVDMFLFIYFLDYVTQTVKYETVIHRVQKQTLKAMERHYTQVTEESVPELIGETVIVGAEESGYYQGFDKKQLIKLAQDEQMVVKILTAPGTHVLQGEPFMLVAAQKPLDEELCTKLYLSTDFFHGQPVERNPDYGFRHITEVAVKALSPGINDPGTAVLGMNALKTLFLYRMHHHRPYRNEDGKGQLRVVELSLTFERLFRESFEPIWLYGKDDYFIRNAFLDLLRQLRKADDGGLYAELFANLLEMVQRKIKQESIAEFLGSDRNL